MFPTTSNKKVIGVKRFRLNEKKGQKRDLKNELENLENINFLFIQAENRHEIYHDRCIFFQGIDCDQSQPPKFQFQKVTGKKRILINRRYRKSKNIRHFFKSSNRPLQYI